MHPAPAGAILVVLGSLILGCGDTPTESEELGDGTALVGRVGNLVQTVTISPATPAPGENVTIRSVVVNRGSTPATLETRICGLDFDGSLELEWPAGIAKCGGYSMHADLAAGDSLLGVDLMEVASPPGRHALRVRHALNPETWATLSVEVRAP
jgi:hypothetical protein